jgi:beta-glucanase (GH16 family)
MRRPLALLLSLAALGSCTGATEPRNYALVWEDEFDGPAGQRPSAANWRFDVGTGWGNAQLEYDTDRAENAQLDGAGNLRIIARAEPWLGSNYTSARITTAGIREFRYGRFEARLRVPTGQGLWPAFWLLGADFATVGWPQTGEIDIMEHRGQEPTVNHGSLHGPGYSGGGALTRRYTLPTGRFDTAFHTYRVDWSSERIRWYVDGQLYHEVNKGDQPGAWVFDHPFYIILNVAVGGGFVGAPDGSTVFPQELLVDWVRVSQAAP